MDMYYAMTNYHLLCCILHKLKFNNNKKSVIYISEYLVNNQPYIIDNVKFSKIFDRVEIFHEAPLIWGEFYDDKNHINIYTEQIVSFIEKKYGSIIDDVENIYTCSDFYGLGIYLNTKNIKYNFFEDGCGMLSKEDELYNFIEKTSPFLAMIVKSANCLGKSDNVVCRYGDLSEQRENYHNKKDVDFSVKKILKSLSVQKINTILKIYGCKKYVSKFGKADLLLTWCYSKRNYMTCDEQKDFYRLLVDYFKTDNADLIIKPHPSDDNINYKTIFPKSYIINGYIPSELIPYCISIDFQKGITNWSTSIYSLKYQIKQIINFDNKIDLTWKEFDRYYAIVLYLKRIKKSNNKICIKTKNINLLQLIRLLETYFSNYKKYYDILEIEKIDYNDRTSFYIVNDNVIIPNKIRIISLCIDKIPTDNVIIINGYNGINKYLFIYNLPFIKLDVTRNMFFSEYVLKIKNIDENNRILLQKLIEKNCEIEKLNFEIKKITSSKSWKITKPFREIMKLIKK